MDDNTGGDDDRAMPAEPPDPARPVRAVGSDGADEPTEAPANDERTPEEAGYGYGV